MAEFRRDPIARANFRNWPSSAAPKAREADEPLVPYHRWLLQRFREFYSPNPKPGLPEPIPGLIYGEPAYEDVKRNGMVVTGTREQVIEQLKVFDRYGVDRVMCPFRIGLMPKEMVMEAIGCFARKFCRPSGRNMGDD